MNQPGMLDLSSLFWDRAAFEGGRATFFIMGAVLQDTFNLLEANDSRVFFSDEILEQFFTSFPLSEAKYSDLYLAAVGFFTRGPKRNLLEYPKATLEGLDHTETLKREHLSETLSKELDAMLSQIFRRPSNSMVFYTFKPLWEKYEEHLQISHGDKKVLCEALILDNGDTLLNYHNRKERVFEDSRKHLPNAAYRGKRGRIESPLSAMIDNGEARCQDLLDAAVGDEGDDDRMFSFDDIHEVVVVFDRHRENIFHGHDEVDLSILSPKVLNELNIPRRSFKVIQDKLKDKNKNKS